MIGTELAGRYEIINRIGGGGMAIVYMGVDLLLNRKVAVKVLRQQYVHDEEFIQRFRREAQSAASLSHPNVVSIYDVGQEEDVHYIVMEYVEGTTLNEIIKERAPLQVEEAIHYATQICDALDHAHHNQIIHRDIKPHNILIGKNGRVKVTDFGIARAVTSSTITQTGSVVGSVHYFSPEHAKGISTGAKSDIYSLGIVLYQMLTSKLPFLGESPISVALKHLQEDFEEPRKVNPLIPQSVENVILKAMRKNQDERYTSAEEMVVDLESCLIPERLNEPKIIFNENSTWDTKELDDDWEDEQTRVLPAISDVRSDTGRLEQRGDSRANNRGQVNDEDDNAEAPRKGRKYFWIKPTVWLMILSIVALSMWYAVDWVKENIVVADVHVPDVVGWPVDQAEAHLTAAQLQPKRHYEHNDEVDKDHVIKQYPEKIDVKVNSEVDVYVSLGIEMKTMPKLEGETMETALELLRQEYQIKSNQIEPEEVFHDEIAPGVILSQEPAMGTDFDPKNVNVLLKVSKGKNLVKMPDLLGLTLAEAKKALDELGLVLLDRTATQEPDYQIDEGKIMKQYHYVAGDEVPVGTEIGVVLSSGLPKDAGPMTVTVPIRPKEPGKESTIQIIVTDAKYTSHTFKTLKISEAQVVDVDIIVSPDKQATIQIVQDGSVNDSMTKTYQDYLALLNLTNGVPNP